MSDHEEKATRTSRRRFLTSGVAACGGLFLTGLFVVRSGLLFLFPNTGNKEYSRYLVGKVDDIPVGGAKEISVAEKPVYLIRRPEGFKVFSGVCPHLGCIIKWKERESYFYCPCHRAVFDQEGTALSGPTPDPLHEYDVEVDGALVFIHIRKRETVI